MHFKDQLGRISKQARCQREPGGLLESFRSRRFMSKSAQIVDFGHGDVRVGRSDSRKTQWTNGVDVW